MEELVELTTDLMKFQTVKGNDEEFEKAFNYIRDYFSDSDLEIFEHEKDGFKTLVAATDEDPEIMLHGHLDVVDAEEEMFIPEERDGRIYGRGSADMKSGLACLMKVMKDLPEDSSVGLMIVSDEEIGGFNGAKYLMDKEEYNPRFALSAEPSHSDGIQIITEQKGIMRVIISAEGAGAHGSKPWEGENAAEKLWNKFSEFKKNFDNTSEWSTTVNLGNFKSEGAMNVVPNHAEAGLDIRWTEEYRPEEIISDLEQIEGLEFKVEAENPQLKTDENDRMVQELKKISRRHGDIEVSRKNPASDMRHFSERDITSVVMGPTGGNVHGENEFVEKDSLETFYDIIVEFLDSVSEEEVE